MGRTHRRSRAIRLALVAVLVGTTAVTTAPVRADVSASITIVKDRVPDGITSFPFEIRQGATVLADPSVSESTPFTLLNVEPGTYTVEELFGGGFGSGFVFGGAVCTDGVDQVTLVGETNDYAIDIDVAAGEAWTCTFTNYQRVTVTIYKETIPDGDPTEFTFHQNFRPTLPETFVLADGDNQQFVEGRAGDFTFTEELPPGWQLDSVVCDEGVVTQLVDGFDITLDWGETPTCTVTNAQVDEPAPLIAIDKQAPVVADADEALTYDYVVTNPGEVPLADVEVTDDQCDPVAYVSGDTSGDDLLDPDETWTFSCSYSPDFWPLAELTNVAIAFGFAGGQQATATDTVTLTPLVVKKALYLFWSSTKPAWRIPYLAPDDAVFTIEVSDSSGSVGTFELSRNEPLRLWLSHGVYTFAEVDVPDGYTPVTWSFGHDTSIDPWVRSIANVVSYDLSIDKTGPHTAKKRSTITYVYRVTNDGPASVRPVVRDDRCASVRYGWGDTDHDGLVDPGEVWTYTCRYRVTAHSGHRVTNTATVAAKHAPRWTDYGGDSDPGNDSDSWTVFVIR